MALQIAGKAYTGYAYALFPNGKISHEFNLVDGYQEGLQKLWHPNGQLSSEVYYSNNLPHGKCVEWFENGVLSFEAEYNMGYKTWSKTYNEKGELVKQFPKI
jgi:uncharacterized protein